MADAPVFFVSYARQDAYYPEDRELLLGFVKKLEARVAAAMGLPPDGVSKMDEHIQAGEIWSEALRDSLMRCRIGVALYSPSYFNRRWCGQEFQIFLNRSRPAPGGTGIVPIRWEQKFEPPDCAARIQYDNGTLPREYISMGMRQLAALKDAFLPPYTFAVQALANRIVEEAKANRLAPLADLDFDKIANPPPHHEWRSIFSREDLDQRTRTVIEQIRSRLMNQLISDPGAAAAPRRAEDTAVAESAAARGIPTRSLSHLTPRSLLSAPTKLICWTGVRRRLPQKVGAYSGELIQDPEDAYSGEALAEQRTAEWRRS